MNSSQHLHAINISADTQRDNATRISTHRQLRKSRHARVRQQQRGIPDTALNLLYRYGCWHHDNHGCWKVFFNKQSRSAIQNEVDHAEFVTIEPLLNAYMIVGDDDTIRTAAWRTRRIKK